MATELRHHALLSLYSDFNRSKIAHNYRTNTKGCKGRRSNNAPASGAEDSIVVTSKDTEQRNSDSIDDGDSGSSSGIVSSRMLRHQESALRFRTRKTLRCTDMTQQVNNSRGDWVALPLKLECGHNPHSQEATLQSSEYSEEQSRAELESRIAWIRGHYREQKALLEDQIEKLKETYNLARAELDAPTREEEAQFDLADDNGDWETMSDYPPTEPRGKSRSPSPTFAVQ